MVTQPYNSIQLELYKNRFASIAEEMGEVLRRAAYSPNIKERLDYSCALFDATGQMVAQAAHMPVHLGAMPMSVKAAIESLNLTPGDVALLNDPFHGGSHLPDITMITPVFYSVTEQNPTQPFAFVASRAHHADVGGMSPGSMPLAQEIFQEGIIIPPLKLVEAGEINQGVMTLLLANVRTPQERAGDLRAQLAANKKGETRLLEVLNRYGQAEVSHYMGGLLHYAERMTRRLLSNLPNGHYYFEDYLEDDGITANPIKIAVTITITNDEAIIDFSDSDPQTQGSVNTIYAVTASAVLYVFRAIIGLDSPANSGCLAPLDIVAPLGTVVNACSPAAVAGGNVETSQRITDVLLGALAQAAPDRVPAASQGSMNNTLIGGWDPERNRPFTYYETIGGGMGAGPELSGADAIHSHMTNTRNTPIEALEYAYPFQVQCYQIRQGSGGAGRYQGGNGIRRELKVLCPAKLTILSERRRFAPYGLMGGKAAQSGKNLLIRNGEEIELPAKTTIQLEAGDCIRIETPGGGGYGDETL